MLNAQFDHGHVLFLFYFCINFCSTVKNTLCCIASDAEKQHIILGMIWLPLFHTADCQISIQSVCSPEEDASFFRDQSMGMQWVSWSCCSCCDHVVPASWVYMYMLTGYIQLALHSVECHMNLQYRFSPATSAKFLDDVTPKINLSMIVNVPVYYVLPTLAEHGYNHWVDLLSALYTLSYTPLRCGSYIYLT